MQFSKITLSALLMGLASNALALPAPQADTNGSAETVSFTGKKVDGQLIEQPAPEAPDSQGLQKRGASSPLVLSRARLPWQTWPRLLSKSARISSKISETGTRYAPCPFSSLNSSLTIEKAREAFTKKTTEEMWRRNPDRRKIPAAVCYNKGYSLRNGNGFDGRVSVKFELGLLKTE